MFIISWSSPQQYSVTIQRWNYNQIWKIFSAIEWKLFSILPLWPYFISWTVSEWNWKYISQFMSIRFSIKWRIWFKARHNMLHIILLRTFLYGFLFIQPFPGQTLSKLWYVWTWSFMWLMSANGRHYIIGIESHFKILPHNIIEGGVINILSSFPF